MHFPSCCISRSLSDSLSYSQSYGWDWIFRSPAGPGSVSCSLDSRNAEIRGGYSSPVFNTRTSSDFIVPHQPGIQVEQNKQYLCRGGGLERIASSPVFLTPNTPNSSSRQPGSHLLSWADSVSVSITSRAWLCLDISLVSQTRLCRACDNFPCHNSITCHPGATGVPRGGQLPQHCFPSVEFTRTCHHYLMIFHHFPW